MASPSADNTSAPSGTVVVDFEPAATIRSPLMITTEFAIGAPPRPSIRVAPTIASVEPAAGGDGGLISRSPLFRSAAVAPAVWRNQTSIDVSRNRQLNFRPGRFAWSFRIGGQSVLIVSR